MMVPHSPAQWAFETGRLVVLLAAFGRLTRDKFFPRPMDNLRRHQRIIRGAGAILVGTILIVAVPVWL